jgi:hypothetical protein|tara:strand:- start:1460 stop:1675 length:216 start_codon:yes stop_codon:yes gene_type:complete
VREVAGGIINIIFLIDLFYCTLINFNRKSRNMAPMVNLIILEQNMSNNKIDGNNVRLMLSFATVFRWKNVG